MNFNQLHAFYVVAREGSFTRAAKHLSVSQPAVTRRILDVEYNLTHLTAGFIWR